MKRLYGLILGYMILGSGMVVGNQEWQESLQESRQQVMLQFLYKTYDEYRNGLVDYLPADISLAESMQVLQARKAVIQQSLVGLSYKNVILSPNSKLMEFAIGTGALGVELVPMIGKSLRAAFPSLDRAGEYGSYFSRLTNYSWRAFFALQAIAGFGLYKDIQAMRGAKSTLTAELTKINAIIALLQKS